MYGKLIWKFLLNSFFFVPWGVGVKKIPMQCFSVIHICNQINDSFSHYELVYQFKINVILLFQYFTFRFQFIPQMIFLNSLFGYLSLLIIVKWCTGSQADLYHIMIYMFLSPTDDLGENQLFVGQKNLQVGLLPTPPQKKPF